MDINDLRKKIDEIDRELLIALARRKDIVKQIGDVKKSQRMQVKDTVRFQEVLRSRKVMAKKLGIPVGIVTSLWDILHEWALEVESDK